MPDHTATAAMLHDVQALRAAQRAAQEAALPILEEMAHLSMLYTMKRWLHRLEALHGEATIEYMETVWTNAEAEALYQQYAAMVRQILEYPHA